MNAPRLVTTPIVRPHPELLGANRDAYVDGLIARQKEYEEAMSGLPETVPPTPEEMQRMADIDHEKTLEGRIIPHRFNRNE